MHQHKVIAFDPGQTTGVAIGSINLGQAGTPNPLAGFRLLEAFEVHWAFRLRDLDALFSNMRAYKGNAVTIDAVVIESFRLYANKAHSQINSAFPSVQVIGAIELLCHQQSLADKIVYQSASEIARVQIVSEDQVYLTSEHMRDAYKHMRLWFVKNRPWADPSRK